MDIAVELSLYPLDADYIPPIQDFIDRLNREPGLRIVTNHLSTQVFGDYDRILGLLVRELRPTFEATDKAVFVMKVLGPYTPPTAA